MLPSTHGKLKYIDIHGTEKPPKQHFMKLYLFNYCFITHLGWLGGGGIYLSGVGGGGFLLPNCHP